MERPEALDAGSIILTGFNTDNVISSIKIIIDQYQTNKIKKCVPKEYLIPDTSHRVLNLIIGTAKLSNLWEGIR